MSWLRIYETQVVKFKKTILSAPQQRGFSFSQNINKNLDLSIWGHGSGKEGRTMKIVYYAVE